MYYRIGVRLYREASMYNLALASINKRLLIFRFTKKRTQKGGDEVLQRL